MSATPTRQRRVLLIDDDEIDAELVRRELAQASQLAVDLVHETLLQTGMERLAQERFDLLLLDLNLPGSRGLETLQTAVEADLEVPIIVLTGLHDDALGQLALAGGADDYLSKGEVNTRQLERSMSYAIERATRNRQIKQQHDELFLRLAKQRIQIARDLHDGVGLVQTLTTEKLKVLHEKLREDRNANAALAAELIGLTEQAAGNLNSVVQGLAPPKLVELGLVAALSQLVRQASGSRRIRVRFSGDRSIQVANPHVAIQLFYIAQEAVQNALKHAGASEVYVNLGRKDGLVVLEIIDNGTGFELQAAHRSDGGRGLHSMQSRAGAIGAKYVVHSAHHQGTKIWCGLSEKKLA